MKRKKEKKERLNKIQVPYGTVSKLHEVFGCSMGYVSDSLNGHYNNELSLKIRDAALSEYKGFEVAPIKKKK